MVRTFLPNLEDDLKLNLEYGPANSTEEPFMKMMETRSKPAFTQLEQLLAHKPAYRTSPRYYLILLRWCWV